jgi:poly(A) polymerase
MKRFNTAKKIVEVLQNSGFTTYFAGGWVRDHLLLKEADDIDIATTATPFEVMALFPKTISVGVQFSILIVVEEEMEFEVATFRSEEGYLDGRRPSKIQHVSPEEDAKRRDFTINSLFYDPIKEIIYDFVGGKQDLEKGIIRAVGDPFLRFKEDRLRMIRACRYSARFCFPIEESTFQAIVCEAHTLFPSVAIERVYDEFKKMTKDPHLFKALLLMHKCSLLKVIFPHLPLISYEELEQKIAFLPKFPKGTYPTIYLYELFNPLSLDQKLALCLYLKVSKNEMKFTEELEKWKQSNAFSDYELVHLYAHPYSLNCFELAIMYRCFPHFEAFHREKMGALSQHIQRLKENTPLITATDLMALGMEKGKELGLALKKALILTINHNCLTKKEVLALMNLENK